METNRSKNYWCEFKLFGSNGKKVRIPYNRIDYIVIDPDVRQGKLYIKDKPGHMLISATEEEIRNQTMQWI